jgi:hypothetical protein
MRTACTVLASMLLVAAGAVAEARPDQGSASASGPGPARARHETAVPTEPPAHEHSLDFLYLKAETGAEYVGLQTLTVRRDLVPSTVRRDDTGPFGGAAAGVKLLFLGIGPHFRLGHFRDWDLWTLNLDVEWLAPLGKIEPYLVLSGGYARLGRAFDSIAVNRSVQVAGYDLRFSIGGDYFVSQRVSVGASLSGEVVGMHRPGVDLGSQDGLINDLYKFDGASAGLGITGALGAGLHL